MAILLVPLTNTPGRIKLDLGIQFLWADTKFNYTAQCWTIDLYDSSNNPILMGVMLVPNVDLMKAHAGLQNTIGSFVVLERLPGDYKKPGELGISVQLVWYPPGTPVVLP